MQQRQQPLRCKEAIRHQSYKERRNHRPDRRRSSSHPGLRSGEMQRL